VKMLDDFTEASKSYLVRWWLLEAAK